MPFVTDTHALIWYMTDDPRLSNTAKRVFKKADNFQEYIIIPCILFFELLYLVEKKKISVDFNSLIGIISSAKNYRIEPLCLPIIEQSRRIPRKKVTDPWDRLIAATSMCLDLPLITRDESLKEIGLKIIW